MQIQAADYPLQVEPAQVLGFDCGLGAGLRICIFFGNKTHVGASFISLAPTLFKSQSALMPLLLLSKPQPLRWEEVQRLYQLGEGGAVGLTR